MEEELAYVEAVLLLAESGWETNETREFSSYLQLGHVSAWLVCSKLKLAETRARKEGRGLDLHTELKGLEQEVLARAMRVVVDFLKPVVAGLTVEDGGGEVCGICLEEMVEGEEARAIQGCKHKYHVVCVYEWFKRKRNCPKCRYQLGVDDLFVHEDSNSQPLR